MTEPAPPPAAGRPFAIVVGAMVAVAAVVIVVVRAGDAGQSAGPAEQPVTTIDIVSDPPGASVTRADGGGVVGITPLTATFPKRDAELAVIVRREGYQERHVTVPLFSVTGRIDVMMLPVGAEPPSVPVLPEHWNP
jgi:hypothetical protein